MNRFQFLFYTPSNLFWFVRCNLVWFRDVKYIEGTFGLLGYGVMVTFTYRPKR